MAIKGKAEFGRAGLEPFEVEFQQRDSLIGSETPWFRSDLPQRHALADCARIPLDQAFAPFGAAFPNPRRSPSRPPAPRRPRLFSSGVRRRVRIATLNAASPAHWAIPVCIRRVDPPDRAAIGAARIALMPAISSIARILGAPVIEPQGNSARTMSAAPLPGCSAARTVVTIWWTVG
jgi:hypothetical protein